MAAGCIKPGVIPACAGMPRRVAPGGGACGSGSVALGAELGDGAAMLAEHVAFQRRAGGVR